MTDEELKYTKRVWRGKRRAEALAQLVALDISPDQHATLMDAYKARKMSVFWNEKRQSWTAEMFYSVVDGAQIMWIRKGHLKSFLDVDAMALEFVRHAVENLRGLDDMKFYFEDKPHLLTPAITEYLASKEKKP